MTSAHAAIGRIYFVHGDVQIERAGARIQAGENTKVESGDTIITGDESRVQWRLEDDSYFALRPNSRFKIEEFQYGAGGDGKAFYSLLAGGFRSITGLVGKSNPSAYQVKTPVATMGIRGTDHTHVLCQNDCGWAPEQVADGLYTRVDAGVSVLSNTDGSLDVGAGKYAKTASPSALLPTMPAVFASWAIDFAINIPGADINVRHEGTLKTNELGVVPSPN